MIPSRKSICSFALSELDDAISNLNDLCISFGAVSDKSIRVNQIRNLVDIAYELLVDLDLDYLWI